MNCRPLSSLLLLSVLLALGCSSGGTGHKTGQQPSTGVTDAGNDAGQPDIDGSGPISPGDGGGSGHDAGQPLGDAGHGPDRDAGNPASDAGSVGDAGSTPVDAGQPPVDAGQGPEKDAGPPPPAPCNGHSELCTRPFDQVVFPCTHNAHSAKEYGFSVLNRNQNNGFEKQLEDGIRCMLADVYDKSGKHMFCHNPDLCFLGSLPHIDGLNIIKGFLEAHPREVLTIIYENGMTGDQIAEDIKSVGLDSLVYTYDDQKGWPTLGEMIDANKRLVITIEDGTSSYPWVRNVWELTWDTPYTFFSKDEFTCKLNRGNKSNKLFLLNHWLNTKISIPLVGDVEKPDESKADEANAYDLLYGRAVQCTNEARKPNFVAVDFYDHGDLFRVVNTLNGF